MYAIVQLGTNQYKVKEGDTIEANRLNEKEGKDLTFDKILLYVNGNDIRVGQPYLKGVSVTAKVVEHTKDKKVIAFKFRRRKESSTIRGHRQRLTALNITKINAK